MKVYALIAAIFFAVTFAVFGSSLHSEFVSWDDNLLITDNPVVQQMNFSTIGKAFSSYDPELYIPLTLVSYQIDWSIGNGAPFMFHFTNIVLHTLNALLVTLVLYLLLENGWLALGLGLLFAIHPLNTEAVVWASGRKDVLSTFFALLSLTAFIRYVRDDARKKSYVASVLFLLLALLSKVMAAMLPAILVLMYAWHGIRLSGKRIAAVIPHICLSAIFIIVALFGKAKLLVSTTLLQKILMAGKSTSFYVLKFFMPTNLSVVYPYTASVKLLSADFILPLLFTVLLIVLTVWSWRRARHVAIGLLIYLVTLLPTFTNFAKGGDLYFASDRYAYLPMIGLLLILGVLASYRLNRPTARAERAARNHIVIVSCVVLVISAFMSASQTKVWATSTGLYAHAITVYPNSRVAHNNLGMEYLLRDKLSEALAEMDAAIAIKRDPRSLVNRATILSAMKRDDEALAQLQQVVLESPETSDAHYGLANIYWRRGDTESAIREYNRALTIDPAYVNALNNLGAVYLELGDWNNAILTLKRSIELRPAFVEAYYNLGGTYEKAGRPAEAEAMYRASLKLKPDDPDALSSLAILLYDRKDVDGAAKLLTQALKIDSSNPIAIGLVLRMKKDGVAE